MSSIYIRKFTILFAILTILSSLFIAYEFTQSFGKQTARMTACIRYASTFIAPPINGQSADIALGYDNYAHYFGYKTCEWLLASPVIRWILFLIANILPGGGAVGHVAARNFIIDKVVIDEIILGASQLVILGAGYDSRALRFHDILKKYNINVFEVDLPSTQFGKQSLLKLNNIDIPEYLTFVGVDFGNDDHDIKQSLKLNGYQETKQTVFIFEGVSPYLYAKDVSQIMKLVSQFSGNNSLIVWDVLHRCIGHAMNIYNEFNSWPTYCKENNMIHPLYSRYHQIFMKVLKEPIYFAVDWDIKDPKSIKNNFKDNKIDYYHLNIFHRNNCLVTEKIYNQIDEESYFQWKQSNRTILSVMKGIATVSARKIDPFCKLDSV